MHKPIAGAVLRLWPLSRHIAPVVIGVACLWLLHRQLDGQAYAGIGPAMARIDPLNWAGAILATAGSFWALGRYDAVIHRHFGTAIPTPQAACSGAAAIALSQVLGFGVVTGTLARWRLLPGLSPGMAMKITLAVAISFLASLVFLLGLVGLILPTGVLPRGLAGIAVVLFVSGLVFCFFRPQIVLWRHRLNWPTIPALLRIACLTALDTILAATALWLLIPASPAPEVIYTAYLCALCAAILSGTPGGVGPFEIVLIASLPALPEADLLGAVVAFRLVYYALPAACAMLLLARPFPAPVGPRAAAAAPIPPRALAQAARAELGVTRQNGATLLQAGACEAAVLSTAQAETILFDPLRGRSPRLIARLKARARQKNRVALVYKCSARVAVLGRRAGWTPLHIADEAVLNPMRFSTEGRAFRQLRRKLRQADGAGVQVDRPSSVPLACLAAIDADWQARNGGARGVTMGRFEAQYLSGQRLYIARQGAEFIGFISFHQNDAELCLDLIRQHALPRPGPCTS